ncbi:MAG TPA: DUF2541 family protein [Pyrinomonadaceae bacterium]|nr:DUF2541 family protein [Acidobacteriota bacterium]HQZ97006.1 DUF2541 family protein [Pyrinomonadaceae bacterium]
MKRAVLMAFAIFLFAAGATAVSAQNWENLGSKEVKDRSEQDTWHITAAKGQFKKIKFAVSRRQVRFYRCEVTYTNGEKDNIEIRNLIRAGGETRAIDLKGNDRYISKVDIWYEAATPGRGARSTVTLYGLK